MTTSHSIQICVTDHAFRPIAGALVSADDASAYTDGNGRARLEVPDGTSIKVEARGYEGQERTVTIMGIDEADSALGQVSWIAPVSRALLKARVGDEVMLPTPAGLRTLEILEVRYPRAEREG